MALKFTKKPHEYISEAAYVYDVAKTSKYFDKSVYDALSETGDDEELKQYIYGIAGAKDKVSDVFNITDYSYLKSPQDKASYTLWMLYGDKNETATDEETGETYNVYDRTKQYFDYQVQKGIDKEIFDNLSGFEKTMNTVGGVVGNALNSVYGMVENILDLGILAVGGSVTGAFGWGEGWDAVKSAAAFDLTGTGAIQRALKDYTDKNTYIGNNQFASYANDVVSGLAQYAINFIPVAGPWIYYGSMAGGAMSEAVSANPEIDYYSLMMYGGAVTAAGFGIEKLSSWLLGGAGTILDKPIQGAKPAALTKLGQFVSKNATANMLGAAASEGLEESIEEFFDVALWNAFVANNYDDSLMKSVSFKDIFYAGLVGGTIGFLMQGGRIATQQKLVQVDDGRIMSKKYATDNNLKIKQEFNKTQSLNITEQLNQLAAFSQTSQVADLRTKYEGLSDEQIQTEHEIEWKEAVEYDELVAKDIVTVVETLAKIHSVLGNEEFNRIVDIANHTVEQTQQLASAYLSDVKGQSVDTQKITEALIRLYGKGISGKVRTGLTPTQQRLVQNLYNRYGVKTYIADIGMIPETKGKIGLTISENTIVLDEKIFGKMSEQEILKKVVREELCHTLQFDKDIIKPETLLAIQLAMKDMTDVTPVELGEAYAKEGTLSKLTEAQAKAIAEVLLFDELTVSNMFYSQYDTLNKVYKKLKLWKKEHEESNQLRKEKNKMSYHEVLVSKKMYETILAEKLGTEANVEQAKSDFSLSEEDFNKLKEAYLPNENVAPIKNGEFVQSAAFAVERKGLSDEAYNILYNSDGTPKQFYKGTNTKGITEFDSSKGAKLRTTSSTWLTSSSEVAKSYANDKNVEATIYTVELSKLENPKILDAEGREWGKAFDGKTTDQIVEETIAENKGYDAIIIKNIIDPGPYSTNRELLKPAIDIAVLDNSKIDIVNEEAKSQVSLSKTDGTQIPLDLAAEAQKFQQRFEKKADRRHRIRKTSEGIQLNIFEYIDDEVPIGEREATRLKAIEQEIPYNKLKPTQAVLDKANKIKELCSELAQSEYQGDIENHKFAKLSDEIFEKGADLFGEITPDEWQAIRGVLFMDLADPRASAALNAVTRYAYLHRANQFSAIADLVKTLYANAISSSGQLIGLSSHDYSNHSVQSFITELAMKHQVEEIPLDEKLILNTAPEFNTVEDFKISLEDQIKTLKQQAKNTQDAYTKWELNRQASSKERILTALNDGDVASAIDEQLANVLESNEDITENLQKQNATYKALIEWLLEHSEFEKHAFKGFASKKIPLSQNLEKAKTFFEGLESFRYMMMLSNPATAAKNAISNTLILGQSYIEDFGTKFFEKSKWLSDAQQVTYTGEYDQTFSKWVDEHYLEKVKNDAEGDKYTSSELRRLQQQYAEAKDPIKKNKLLNSIQTLERKLLNDKFWVTHRTMMNLKNTLAGSSDLILADSRSWLASRYKGTLNKFEITDSQLIANISKTNKELAELYSRASSGDKTAILQLATKLNADIVSPDLKQQNSIYYHSFYRANKMFFKIDNWFTRVMSNLNQKYPAMAYIVRHFIPFVRVTANSTSYIIDRSPIGLAKGVFKAFQTKVKWQYQMKLNIEQYYKQQYSKIMSSKNPDFKFNQSEFETWLNSTVDDKTQAALSGDKKALTEVFNTMVENGMVNSGSIGSDNLYARADIMEQLSQGVVGTSIMTIGLLLGALTDAFEYDDDDEYLGPVVKLGDLKIGLGELSPFSTLFTMGAMLTSSKVDNKIEAAFNIFADATILSTLDSALTYSDGVWDYLKNQSINIIGQYQPAITKAISKLVYNSKKDKSGNWGVKLLKTLGANSLLFNYLVPNKINPYTGKAEKYYDTGWFEGLFDIVLPVGVRVDGRSELEKEAEAVGAQTTGLSGKFTINDVDYTLTNKTKEKYAKYKAQYINNRFEKIKAGTEKVTLKDKETGKYKTTTYNKLTKEEKSRVLKNLYSNATEITKIQYWLDNGNYYYTTDKDTYIEYKKLFGSSAKIVYRKSWGKSKFVEG